MSVLTKNGGLMIVFQKMNVFNYSAFTAALNHQEVSYGKIQLQL